MAATNTSQVFPRSASDLGRRVGLTGQEFNVALQHAGLLKGEPGAWLFTDHGRQLATTYMHDNGHGGIAARAWDVTTWPESVIEKLDLSEAGVTRIRQFLADRKTAQRTTLKAARVVSDNGFLADQAKQAAGAPDVARGSRALVLVGVGLGGIYGLSKAVPALQRRWQHRTRTADEDQRPGMGS
jgi:hypothetical protein